MANFFLIAWAGEPPTWSIVDPKKIRGEREPGEITEAQWDDGNWYPCEVLVGASKLLCWQFDPVCGVLLRLVYYCKSIIYLRLLVKVKL